MSTDFQTEFRNIPIFEVFPPSREVREVVSEEGLADLLGDIRQHGIINPLTVKPRVGGGWEIVAGMRRYMCAQRLGMRELPCTIRYDDARTAEFVKLAENFKREDVNPYDEGKFYKYLLDDHGLSEKDIAEATNRSDGYIRTRLGIVNGDTVVAEAVRDGLVGVGVGLELNKIANEEKRLFYLKYAIDWGATLRMVSQWTRDANLDPTPPHPGFVPVTDPMAEFQPSRLVWFCELCKEEVQPDKIHVLRSCGRCKAALLRQLRELEE